MICRINLTLVADGAAMGACFAYTRHRGILEGTGTPDQMGPPRCRLAFFFFFFSVGSGGFSTSATSGIRPDATAAMKACNQSSEHPQTSPPPAVRRNNRLTA